MIEGQKDSEAEEVDKGGERTPWCKKKELKVKKGGIQKWDVRLNCIDFTTEVQLENKQ